MKLIVGLGNPGAEYAHTRHNVGFMVVDALARTLDADEWRADTTRKAELTKAQLDGEDVLLAKATTFMNDSGVAVQALAHYYKIAPADIVVVQDDIDMQFGKLRVRGEGGSGGHNGIKSVQQHVGDEFMRFRIGVANPDLRNPLAADVFVLQRFNDHETPQLPALIDEACRELRELLASPQAYSKHLLS